MSKLRYIAIGWSKSLGLLPVAEAEQKLSDLRMSICSTCPASKVSTALKIINGEAVKEHALYCTKCKCPCKQKTLVVNEKCPLGRW